MNETAMTSTTPLFGQLLTRLEILYESLDKQVTVTREKVTKLAVCNDDSSVKLDSGLAISKTPETIIEKLNNLVHKLENTSDHLAVTVNILNTLI